MECWHCPKERLCCSAMEQQYLCPSVCGLGALLLEETCSLPHRLVALRERKEQAAAPRLVLGCALEVALSPWEWGQRGPEGKETACRLSLPWLITVCCSLLFKKKKKKNSWGLCAVLTACTEGVTWQLTKQHAIDSQPYLNLWLLLCS